MNGNKLAALAFAASLAATSLPTFAATGTVQVKWNTQAIANLTLTTQASAATTHAASENIYQGFSGATTSAGCNGAANANGVAGAAGTDAEATSGTINFGNVTPDGAVYVNCLEINALNANITTNDTNGYTVSEQMTAGVPAAYGTATGELLCILPNGTYANNLAYTASGRSATAAISSATACPAGDFIVSNTAATQLLATTASTTGTNLGQDMELVVAPNAATNTVVATVTYTLTTL